jgi:eukaryotic translation initiation factor 2C
MVKGDLASALAASSLDIKLPLRPAYGVNGKAIVLYTNYYELKGISPDTLLYRYSVAFQPDNELPKPKKKRLVELLLQMAPFAGLPIASDWAQILVTPKNVPLDKRASYKLEWFPADGEALPAEAKDEPERVKQARRRNTHQALVEDIGTVSVKDLLSDLSQPTSNYPLKLETIQALNVIMAHGPSSERNIATANGNKFYPFGNHPQVQLADLGGGLQAVRGYFGSVRTGVNRILFNLNVATGAFYKSGPLLEVMQSFTGGPPPANQIQLRKLAAFVRKLRFETNYIQETDKAGKVKKDPKGRPITKRKVHSISDLSRFGQNARTMKFNEVGANGVVTEVSVEAYFLRKYGIRLTAWQAPLVNYGTAQDAKWLPAELCTILPGQLAKRLLQGDQTSKM